MRSTKISPKFSKAPNDWNWRNLNQGLLIRFGTTITKMFRNFPSHSCQITWPIYGLWNLQLRFMIHDGKIDTYGTLIMIYCYCHPLFCYKHAYEIRGVSMIFYFTSSVVNHVLFFSMLHRSSCMSKFGRWLGFIYIIMEWKLF